MVFYWYSMMITFLVCRNWYRQVSRSRSRHHAQRPWTWTPTIAPWAMGDLSWGISGGALGLAVINQRRIIGKWWSNPEKWGFYGIYTWFMIAKLVNITPISLCFMIFITIVFMVFINQLITGGQTLYKAL